MRKRRILFIWLLCLIAVDGTLAQIATEPASIPVEVFAQLPVMTEAALSPDGSHISYLRPINGRNHLVIQALASDAKPVVVPPYEGLDFDWLHWANSDRLVFAVSAFGRRYRSETHETRLLAIDEDGQNGGYIVMPSRTRGESAATQTGVKLPPPQIQDDVIDWLPDEPDWILVALDGDHDNAHEVRRINVHDGSFTVVQDGYTGIQRWMVDQAGEIRLGWGYRNESFQVRYKNSDGDWDIVTNAAWLNADQFPIGFSENPDVVYMHGPDEDSVSVIRTYDMKTGQFLDFELRKDGYDISGLRVDPYTGRPVGAIYTEHYPQIEYFDDTFSMLQRSVDKVQPMLSNQLISLTADKRKVLVFSQSDVDPGRYYFWDRDTGSFSFITESMPGLSPGLTSSVQAVSFEASDGWTIPAYLTIPKHSDAKGLPVVVMPHGGPQSRDTKSFFFLTQFLASRGYAIFQPNFRGSSGYGRIFEEAGQNEWGGRMQDDVTDGTQWLIAEGIADADRICIAGWSYGGYAAAMGAVKTPGLFRCAASINGVLDLPRLIADDRRYVGGSVWTRHMGLDGESAKTVSPYHQAERISVPMLIIQAKDDPRVHADQGQRMAKRLKRLGKTVRYIELELGGHSMRNQTARETILDALETFLAENIGAR